MRFFTANDAAADCQSMHRQLLSQWQRSLDCLQELHELSRSRWQQSQQRQMHLACQYIELSYRQMGLFWSTFTSTAQASSTDAAAAFEHEQGLLLLISNGTSSTGQMLAAMLAAQGHRVVICHSHEHTDTALELQQQAGAAGHYIEAVGCDTSCGENCEQIIRQVIDRHGPIDVLINCANVNEDSNSLLDAYLDSTFNITRNVIPEMSERGIGRIINIAPAAANTDDAEQQRWYQATRAGIQGFSKALADELCDRGIAVNIVLEDSLGLTAEHGQRHNTEQITLQQQVFSAVSHLLDEDRGISAMVTT